MDTRSVNQLRVFVEALKASPDLLHDPSISFFKEYLLSLDATIPPLVTPQKEKEPEPEPTPAQPEPEPEPMEDSSEDEESVELDNTGVLEEDPLLDLSMGDDSKQPTDEEMDKSGDLRAQAMCAMSDGNAEEALKLFTEAIELNPHAAALFAKRSQYFIRQKKPANAIRDAEKALSLNPDNSLAQKCKGKGLRLLGKWEESMLALSSGQKIDYDDDTQELLNTIVKPNAEKLRQARLRKESKQREKDHKAKLERVRKAREQQHKAYEAQKEKEKAERESFTGGMPGGMPGGMSGGMPGGMEDIFSDPEIATLLQDPEVVQAMTAIQQNPAAMMQYINNPKVMKIVQKLQGKFAGGGGPGGMGGFPGMPGGGGGGMPGGFPGGMAGAPPSNNATSTNNSSSTTPPNTNSTPSSQPRFTTCDDVD